MAHKYHAYYLLCNALTVVFRSLCVIRCALDAWFLAQMLSETWGTSFLLHYVVLRMIPYEYILCLCLIVITSY